jgi:pimeloyl-ACP methyl ester carboxylesterase
MVSLTNALSAVVVAGGLVAAALGLGGAANAQADPPPPPLPAEANGAPIQGEVPPDWAPRKPADFWNGEPIVWFHGWGGRWGVWKGPYFIPLTSNPVTGGG